MKNDPAPVTLTIAGHALTLVAGVRYRASRPFAERGRRIYPVTIEPIDGADVPFVVVHRLDLAAANALVGGFNNGATSFDGRVWSDLS